MADPKDRNTFLLAALGETAADGSNGHFFLHEIDSLHFPKHLSQQREEIAVLLVVEMKDSPDYFIFLCSLAQAQKGFLI